MPVNKLSWTGCNWSAQNRQQIYIIFLHIKQHYRDLILLILLRQTETLLFEAKHFILFYECNVLTYKREK